ncbi:MAG: hypothetical protein A2942_00335 [Candidatus Lloydbacteria bacterium RIFCSPLOWO2_01_FULL_50_20]|uniref:Methyltransferase type 11 domain-containing protein n=1 Tax=Candidatus Lloydbacteria bacterium RIFCSPLOWO2_01_FULL_50_20 TaxID=1798665 RepID=A0A1G2DG38_9BACT|nr:MAG: hypothetical protein A3C13_04195 [Candidatus Lloydbacteria bacterium RIFCSPHIGHO2_02_FULL_50_11]OGZ12546.1 MAG: hypothetical protein A2942_00335 [Candidatus Lloydbacteria bacterium RIFCSPLOWO2_01_FULL_50_20]
MRTTDQRFQAILTRNQTPTHQTIENDGVSNSIKTFVKRWPWFYNFLKHAFGPSHSPGSPYHPKRRIHDLLGNNPGNKIILNLGSGTYRIHPEIINVDLFPFKEVDLVADICALPIKDASVDGIVCEDVLEHIAGAPRLLKEISRVLKPGGTLILKVPFLYPYHSSPDDFFRWTANGIMFALEESSFRVKESGPHGGPMGALQGVLMHIFAIMFSFGSNTAYFFLVQFFMVVFSPLKLLDPLFLLSPFSVEVASQLFVVAEKK